MIVLALLAAVAGPACPPDPESASPRLYRVVGTGRVPFYRSADCKDASCAAGSYVVPGDALIVYGQAGGRSCALFSRTQDTTGWVDTDRLRLDATAAAPAPTQWAGEWRNGDDHIRLTPSPGGRLRVVGEAFWPAAPAHLPKGSPSGWPHTGDLDGVAAVVAGRADYRDGDDSYVCKATLRLLGPYLLVDDNGDCGGMNVRFTGVYRRGRDAPR